MKKLRQSNKDTIGQGSEIAEMLLHGIMHDYYNALPVVPKIFYKQNPGDNAKGADSVHIILDGENDFSIWMGEAKFYTSLSGAIDAAVVSVCESLQTQKIRNENTIIVGGNSDLYQCLHDDPDRAEKIRSFLDDSTSIDEIKHHLHIPILLLYECPNTQHATENSGEYKQTIKDEHCQQAITYFKKQFEKCRDKERYIHHYCRIGLHLVLFPVPDKTEIVRRYTDEVKHLSK